MLDGNEQNQMGEEQISHHPQIHLQLKSHPKFINLP